ncbi:CtsR family transcriptional regulator [Christensenella timonensis]|uniref:CtsR family transcriptional regulator n=1 Tax=Christensenella timonensis TaxID=1816678 RepID=UPI000836BB19|nr:CtsR family transcriptional regulator [Christensenella timonensis]
MSVLSDHIEDFIKELLMEDEGMAELQRNELAQRFHCAPSQINYVLTTRFSPNRGYITQSRRGGGGYIRVIQLDVDESEYISDIIDEKLQGGIGMRQAAELVEGMRETGLIDKKSKNLILAAISDKALCVPGEIRNELRSCILREILISTLLKEDD